MKPKFPLLLLSFAFASAVWLTVPTSQAGPLGQAAGKYDGKLSGVARVPFLGSQRLPKTDAKLKLPRGKGRIVIRIEGFERTAGKVTKVRVRQGGKKVVQIGKTKIPASVTAGLPIAVGSITGPFKAVVNLSGVTSTVRATTTLKKFGATVKGVFNGSQ